jgi:hypothetical protein
MYITMGAGSSTVESLDQGEIINSISKSCTAVADSVQEIKDIKLTLSGNARCNNVSFRNYAMVEATCDMQGVSEVVSKKANEMISSQEDGYLSFGSSEINMRDASSIKTYLDTKCSSNSSARQTIEGLNIEIKDDASCDRLDFYNESSLQANCALTEVTKITNELENRADSKQKGIDWAKILMWAGILAGICLLILVIVKFC